MRNVLIGAGIYFGIGAVYATINGLSISAIAAEGKNSNRLFRNRWFWGYGDGASAALIAIEAFTTWPVAIPYGVITGAQLEKELDAAGNGAAE